MSSPAHPPLCSQIIKNKSGQDIVQLKTLQRILNAYRMESVLLIIAQLITTRPLSSTSYDQTIALVASTSPCSLQPDEIL